MSEKNEKLISEVEKHLGTTDVSFEKKTLEDRNYSSRGWQSKKLGNSNAGSIEYNRIKQNYSLVDNKSRDARNDMDFRYFIKEFYVSHDNKELITVSNDPSRSGKSNSWTFCYIKVNKK